MEDKSLEKLIETYHTMRADYVKDLTNGMIDWQYNHVEHYLNAPASVQFVKMMDVMGQPIGLETYERALKEGPEYFPDEIEYRRKWALIPQSVKDAYNADPNSDWAFNFGEIDEDAPYIVNNWPGIIGATDEDWRIRDEWYNSETYKSNLATKNKDKCDAYNKYFGPYGLYKTLDDYK